MSKSGKGFILGVVAAVSYGTNPLFAVPLYASGMSTESVLFYRYGFATLILAAIMLIRGESFRLLRKTILPVRKYPFPQVRQYSCPISYMTVPPC